MLMTLAGAMSTAELGISLAEMIRQDKVHAIVCTGANLEEDIFNLVAHDYYERVPHYRHLTTRTRTSCSPAHEPRDGYVHPRDGSDAPHRGGGAGRMGEGRPAGERYFPHEFMYKVIRAGKLKKSYQIDPKNSWMVAAAEKNLPISCPVGRMRRSGNMYAGHVISGDVKNVHTVRTGIEYMMWLAEWYTKNAKTLRRTARARSASSRSAAALRAISRSVWCRCCTRTCSAPACRSGATSARSATPRRATAATPARCRTRRSPGANSGATTPKFIIESDATIVAPLIFAWVLGRG
jgi:deoxyhypusine synthase